MKIEDGTGASYRAKVSDQYRLLTESLTTDESVSQTFEGRAYNVNTGSITLTSANASGVLYMLNTGSTDIVITSLIYLLGTSTGGSGNINVKVYRNPTAGTLISGGTSFAAVNRDFGSANTLSATIKKGAEGQTVTDGSIVTESLFTSVGRQVIAVGALVLRPGNSIALVITPQTGNTSMVTQWAFSCYEKAV